MVVDDDVADTGEALELRQRHRAGEAELDLVVGEIAQGVDAVDLDDAALTDDGHPVAGLLHLGQDVAGEEDRPSLRLGLSDELEERLLDERIEAGRRLVEDEQLRPVLEGDDEPDLLLVALGVLLEASRRVQVEALDEAGLVARLDAAAQVGEVGQRLAAREPIVERELAGHVADASVDGDRVGSRLDAEHGRPAARRADVIEQDPDRRRLAGAVGTEEAEDLAGLDDKIDLDDAAMRAIRLAELLRLDDGGHVDPSGRHTWRARCAIVDPDGKVSTMTRLSWPRRVALATLAAITIGAPAGLADPATAQARAPYEIDLYRSGDFVSQTNLVQCVGASIQMMRNIGVGRNDRTAATQRRFWAMARRLSPPRPPGFGKRQGASVHGWSAALRRLDVGPYTVLGYPTMQQALIAAARSIQRSGKPVGLLVWGGRHAWVMSGFQATADPRRRARPASRTSTSSTPSTPGARRRGAAARGPVSGSPWRSSAGTSCGVRAAGRDRCPGAGWSS